MNLDNIGDPNTLVWLFCELQTHGKTLIRKGWREGLPQDKSPQWVFCPLLRKNFPRDRKLVVECEKCPHYKGVSHSLKRTNQKTEDFKIHIVKAKKVITKEMMKQLITEREKENEEWIREERRIFGDSTKY